MKKPLQGTQRTLYLTKLAILTALLLFLEITGIGYIRLPGISMTIMQVPVIIGAIVLGPLAGAILGTIFGLTSFWQAFGKDPFGAVLLGIDPVGLFITTVPTRILMGLGTGLIYQELHQIGRKLRLVVSSLSGALLNTLLFMSMFVLFFFNSEPVQGIAQGLGTDSPIRFAVLLVGVQGLVEAGICTLLGSAIAGGIQATSIGRSSRA